MGLIFKWPSKQCSSVLPGSGDTSLQFSFLHTLRDKKHRDRILVKILLNLRTTLYDLLESTWCWFRGCRMVTMRWARRQVSKEKRENRWSQTEIEKWARSQGCCSAGNLDDCWLKLLTFEKYILRNWEKLAHVWPQIWFDEWDISVVILTLQVSQVTVLSGLHGAGRGRGSSRREQASQGEGRSGNCLDFYDFNIWSQTSVYCDDSISDT